MFYYMHVQDIDETMVVVRTTLQSIKAKGPLATYLQAGVCACLCIFCTCLHVCITSGLLHAVQNSEQ